MTDTAPQSPLQNTMSADIGARIRPGGVSFRVWAPGRQTAVLVVGGVGAFPMRRDEKGYFAVDVDDLGAGARYSYRLDQDERLYPDPASCAQPDGPHAASMVVDHAAFDWTDGEWPGLSIEGQIIYEMHVGTFTPEGTWAAAATKLPFLREMGVTCIEMMPVAEFPGRFGWGYDGVDLFAPSHLYGRPEDLKSFIDAAHRMGIGVILDVVYNHFGPDGNYLSCFSADYFSRKHKTDWGEAINFDGQNSAEVRNFFFANAVYWIREFHFDGLRFDATQSVFDDSAEHILIAMSRAMRAAAAPRSIILVAENEPQETRIVRPLERGGYGMDALWNDDFHHSAMVALTGRAEAYYEDHAGAPQEFISAAKYGYLFQGQIYAHQGKPRGYPGRDLSSAAFVSFVQNHDQIANSATGQRFHQLSDPGRARAMTALFLLMPGTPMLFQGQEFGASSPFLYFADHGGDLARLVREGRLEFMSQFPSVESDADLRRTLPSPESDETFRRCKLDWAEAERNEKAVALHRDLIAMRRTDPTFSDPDCEVDGAVIGRDAFVLRYFGRTDDRLLVVNFGRDLLRRSLPEPLVAPPEGCGWDLMWSSQNPAYGGQGTPPTESEAGWHVPAGSAIILKPVQVG